MDSCLRGNMTKTSAVIHHPSAIRISVIIPIYNVEQYLRRCLDSVLCQTFSDWEAVCVNDGSPDNSAAILDEYAARDSRIRVITQKNGGLSDARNTGMKHARGEYVLYLDSDDFIHPQTMEISYALAKRDDSDIVTWYKDKLYRPQLLIRHKLGLDTEKVMPRGICKKYNLGNIKSFVTDDIFAHTTERSHTGIKWPVKHFYAWRSLLRRDFIKDIDFIKGITFEDFPWWSEVILNHPRTTITNLPFYYYYPNLNSIDMASGQVKKIKNWIIGLEYSYKMYCERADIRDFQRWQREIMWTVIIYQIFRKIKYINDDADKKFVREKFIEFNNMRMFDNPPTGNAKKYRRRILEFISNL